MIKNLKNNLNNKKKVLVTGSTGFIGTYLIKKLTKYDVQKDVKNNKRIDLKNKLEVLNLNPVDYVIHLAAKIPQKEKNDPSYFFENNILSTLNILEFCIKKKIKKLIYISSYPYGIPNKIPIQEDHSIKPHTPYSESKYICEQLCKFYNYNYGLKIIILRPFNIYGKSQKLDFLIPNLVDAIKTGKKITVTNKKSKRDFLFINDFTNAILSILDLETQFDIFNIGSGESYSFEEIIKTLENLTRKKLSIDYKIDKKIQIDDIKADISKITQKTGWKPLIRLEDGLKEML